jgi:large subunit ribosomal protein L21
MAYAVIETGGKQYRVQVGDQIEVEKLEVKAGDKVDFAPLLIGEGEGEGETIKLGRPKLDGALVSGEVVDQIKGPKLISYIYRKRKSSEKKVGHRQPLTIVKITDIKG